MFKPITIYARVTHDKSITKTTETKIVINRSSIKIEGGYVLVELDTEVLLIRIGDRVEVIKGSKHNGRGYTTKRVIQRKGVEKVIVMLGDVYSELEDKYGDAESIFKSIEATGVQGVMGGVAQGKASTIIIAEVVEESVREDEEDNNEGN